MLARITLVLIVAVLAVFAGFYAWAWQPEFPAVERQNSSAFDPAVVARGAQLSAVGSCSVCHTRLAGGASYAGGYPVETPFGTIYGTNITPDTQTGIGSWSFAAFKRAMREGVDRQGHHLYPAFPYDHFTHATDSDLEAIYDFFMTRDPVRQANRAPHLIFPLNIRLFAAGWKLLFLHKGTYVADNTKSAKWNRGAYLAETFGHCGACHTPRNALGAERRGQQYAGGVGEGWLAPALNADSPAPVPWSADAVARYLQRGFEADHGVAAGPMATVTREVARADADDLRALGIYIASLNAASETQVKSKARSALKFAEQRTLAAHDTAAQTTGSGASNLATDGAAVFSGACASCHHRGGELPITRPIDLALSSAVNDPDARDLIHVILNGIHPAAEEPGHIMPAFDGTLTDKQIISLVNYLRAHFTTKSPWVHPDKTLAAVRGNKGGS